MSAHDGIEMVDANGEPPGLAQHLRRSIAYYEIPEDAAVTRLTLACPLCRTVLEVENRIALSAMDEARAGSTMLRNLVTQVPLDMLTLARKLVEEHNAELHR